MPGNRPALGVIFAAVTKSLLLFSPGAAPRLPRRAFLRYAGATSAGAALLLAGCKKAGTTITTTTTTPTGEAVTLGSGDVALINLLQAGKQLAATLLDRIVVRPDVLGLTSTDLALLTAIRDQQTVHRDALKAAANANRSLASNLAFSLPDLPADFSAVDFTRRAPALTAVHTLLNTLVAGAAGMLRYSPRAATLTLLGQVLSVDARHAATLARLLPAATVAFTDPQDSAPDARNRSLRPAELVAALNPMITFGSRLVSSNLP